MVSHLYKFVNVLAMVAPACLHVLQHMDNQELTRRMATGTLFSTSVMARAIVKLSTDPTTAIKNAQVNVCMMC